MNAPQSSHYSLLLIPGDSDDCDLPTVHLASSPDSSPIWAVRIQYVYEPDILLCEYRFHDPTQVRMAAAEPRTDWHL